MAEYSWLLFLPQLPSSPSSLRVMVWRRLRSAGAVSLQNGVCILPDTPNQLAFASELLAEVQASGGSGLVLSATALAGIDDPELIERFRSERDQEYDEFQERCSDCRAALDAFTQAVYARESGGARETGE